MAPLALWKSLTQKLRTESGRVLLYSSNRPFKASGNEEQKIAKDGVKPFSAIPGPPAIPGIGTFYLYFLGIYSFKYLHKSGMKKLKKYGPIVRETIVPGNSVVWIFDPKDMERLFQSESQLPQRRSHLAVGVFRKDRPDVYNSGGLLPTNGEEWWKLRREFQKGFSAPQAVRAYLPSTDSLIKEFVSNRLILPCQDFLPELSRLFLQLTCLVAFDEKFDCFSVQELKPESRSSLLMNAAFTANSLVLRLDNAKDVKKAFGWKRFEKSMLDMEKVAMELVKKKAASMTGSKESEKAVPSLLELYLTSPNLDYKDVIGMSVDLLLAGIDTTAYTASFALYHLARNKRVQDFLRLEARSLLPSREEPITPDILARATYLRAVLKEVFRMNPIAVGVGRVASQDLVLSGFNIPEGTNVVTQNQVSCRLEKYFVKPNNFLPERWLKGSPVETKENPYLVLPFGHGSRSCIARRLAEQHLHTLLLRIVRDYQILWNSRKHLDCESLLINKPDGPVTLSFSRV